MSDRDYKNGMFLQRWGDRRHVVSRPDEHEEDTARKRYGQKDDLIFVEEPVFDALASYAEKNAMQMKLNDRPISANMEKIHRRHRAYEKCAFANGKSSRRLVTAASCANSLSG